MNSRYLSFKGLLWLVVVILLAWLAGQQARNWQLVALHQQGAEQLLGTVTRLRTALAEYRYLPFLLTQNDDVRTLLRHGTGPSERVSRYLEQMNLVAGASGLFILDTAGQTVAYSHWREGEPPLANSHADQPYFREAWSGEQLFSFSLQQGAAPAVFISAPIYAEGEAVGVAVVRINLPGLLTDLSDDDRFTVSDDRQQIILAHPPAWQLHNLQSVFTQHPPYGVDEGLMIQRYRIRDSGQLLMGQSVRLDDLGWTVRIYQPLTRARQHQQLVIVATLLSGGLLGLLLLLRRERRLKKLSLAREQQAEARHLAQQRTIISRSEVGLITLDALGQVLFINPMAQRQFGVSMPLIEGISLRSLLSHPDDALPLQRALSLLGTERFVPLTSFETQGRRGDESVFPMLLSIRPMTGLDAVEYLVTVIDISRRKRLEQALVEANESLEHKVRLRTQALEEAQQALVHAEKLAALGRMSSAMVHELNQPLTAMRTYIAICRQLTAQPEQLAENLALLDQLAERMAQLTRQLKVFAARKPEQLRAVPLAAVLGQVATLFQPRLAARNILLEIEPVASELTVMGDSARLEQVFSNLLQNSLDAIPAEASQGWVRIGLQIRNERLQLRVDDSGPGVPETLATQLFEPFVTSKPLGSGLGLGLAIVASIVRDLGGHIEACNLPQGGARFTITLQLAPASQLQQESCSATER